MSRVPGWSTIGVSSREVYATHHPKGSTPTGVAKSPRALLQIRESSVPVQIGTAIPRRVGPSVSSVGYTHLDAVTEIHLDSTSESQFPRSHLDSIGDSTTPRLPLGVNPGVNTGVKPADTYHVVPSSH